jgi:two-component system response regulator FlrC
VLRVLCIDDDRAWVARTEEALRLLGHEPVSLKSDVPGPSDLDVAGLDLVLLRGGCAGERTERLTALLEDGDAAVPVVTLDGDTLPNVPHGIDVPGFPAVGAHLERIRVAVDRALVAGGLKPRPADSAPFAADLVGDSPLLAEVLDVARSVASSSASVLVEGESGTGKELLVRSIHAASPRSHRAFVAVNCAALPEGLIESTLFGHEKGAFTGASQRFIGAFERAHGGTLLLDEISELRLDLQAKLLRAIQEKQFERVGGSHPISVDVRLVATTNRDLEAEARAGRFRSDLYYRLKVVHLHLPALRERVEDIPMLVRHFLETGVRGTGRPVPKLAPETLAALAAHPWEGNVRELQHAVERAVLLHRGAPLTFADFVPARSRRTGGAPVAHAPASSGTSGGRIGIPAPFAIGGGAIPTSGAPVVGPHLDLDLRTLEKRAILAALERTGGHRTRAAQLLGISDRTLRTKLKAWKISVAALWRCAVSGAEDSSGAEESSGTAWPASYAMASDDLRVDGRNSLPEGLAA